MVLFYKLLKEEWKIALGAFVYFQIDSSLIWLAIYRTLNSRVQGTTSFVWPSIVRTSVPRIGVNTANSIGI